jgi:hypothetical protein
VEEDQSYEEYIATHAKPFEDLRMASHALQYTLHTIDLLPPIREYDYCTSEAAHSRNPTYIAFLADIGIL